METIFVDRKHVYDDDYNTTWDVIDLSKFISITRIVLKYVFKPGKTTSCIKVSNVFKMHPTVFKHRQL